MESLLSTVASSGTDQPVGLVCKTVTNSFCDQIQHGIPKLSNELVDASHNFIFLTFSAEVRSISVF